MGLTQEALAERAGLHHPTYISMIENGHKVPTLEVAHQLVSALELRLSRLIAEAEAATGPRRSSE